MTWGKLCDTFWMHPKVVAVGNEAVGAFARMISYSSGQLTDGHVPSGVAKTIAPPRILARLVEFNLLELAGGGWKIHDFSDFNPLREEVLSERRKTADRVANFRRNKAKDAECNAVTNGVTNAVSNAVGNTVGNAAPTRPDPTRPDPLPSVVGGAGGADTAPAPTADPEPAAPTDPASAAGASTPSAAPAQQGTPAPRKRRERKPPPPDTIPLPGTPARAIYDAMTGDPVLRPIVAGPGDFAARLADRDAYPGVAVLAEIKRAAEYASRHPGQYTDGRRYLTTWLSRAAERVPPKPASPTPAAPARPALTDEQLRAISPFANLKERLDARDARKQH